MGNPKQKWTSEEEEALRAGIAKYGPGKWKFIQRDPEFNQFLHSRSNIDLKDKWRNMSAAAGQGSRDKLRPPKAKTNQDALGAPMFNAQTSACALPIAHDLPADQLKDNPSKELPDAKNGPRYNAMIFEALLMKEPNGLDISSIVSFIEQRIEVPQNFRKMLGSRLRRLVAQEKLDKVDNRYRIKNDLQPEKNTTSVKDVRPRQSQSGANHLATCETVEEAATTAAYKIAEAENKSFVAAEAVKEAERIARMAEESDSVLQFAKEIFDRCTRGEVVLLA
ncbi:hypothetical protein Nepgr_019928 [Nepenthes gracilis]|uniref:MYB transcription factor n=1 Tax=Nepenthes gracilis TaxID=150966 RepID=A0AAD3XUJ9_NEPGR|nr:hypothetical protein Nepgr_019928 [Nepenthes gracilis]